MREKALSYNLSMHIEPLKSGTYILAISGGVDSMVLLDMLLSRSHNAYQFIVAHVNHGIRTDSDHDEALVRAATEREHVRFEAIKLQLGPSASEDEARQARYQFLEAMRKKYQAAAIITAHHQDDVIETALLNLLRGTGWRGLASLRSTTRFIRPLLHVTKQQIREYAQLRNVTWREDSTNNNQMYRRNWVRHKLLPMLEASDADFKQSFNIILRQQTKLRAVIENEIEQLAIVLQQDSGLQLSLYKKIDEAVANELLRQYLMVQHISLTRPQLLRLHTFAHAAHRNQKHSLGEALFAARRGGLLVVERG